MKGKAFKYVKKDFEEFKREYTNSQKAYIVSLYMKYIAKEQLEEKFKKWLSNNEQGTKALRRRMTSLSGNHDEGSDRGSLVMDDDDDFSNMLEKILHDNNFIIPYDIQEPDLTFEEKLLLVSTFGLEGNHLVNGNLRIKEGM